MLPSGQNPNTIFNQCLPFRGLGFKIGAVLATFADMRKHTLFAIIIAGSALLLGAWTAPWQRSAVKAHMRVRTAQEGYTSLTEADLYYDLNGRMVSFYSKPREYVLITNNKGAMQVYDPASHTVYQDRNPTYSTENSQMYFFLQHQRYDLGLSTLGFTNVNTYFDDGLMITEWAPPTQASDKISQVKLVHEQARPIYLEYKGTSDEVIKKTYFYGYQTVGNREFPTSITQIDYFEDRDSLLTKTEFTDFVLDAGVAADKLNYQIPADARLITTKQEENE